MSASAVLAEARAIREDRAALRPSLLPWIDRQRGGCAQFVPDPESNAEIFELGRDRHVALVACYKGDDSLVDMLPPVDAEGVRWAVEYMRNNAATLDYPIEFEQKVYLVDAEFREVFPQGGTPDAVCGYDVFDLKWRPKNYAAQLAAYSIMHMQKMGFDWVRVHALYGATQRATSWKWTEAEAWEVLRPVLDDYHNPDVLPSCGSSCGSCAIRLKCPAFNVPAVMLAQGREDWGLEQYHVTVIETPEQMARALCLAKFVRKWLQAIDFYKRDWMIKRGLSIPGFKIRHEEGDRQIVDLNRAFRLSGIPLEKFIGICSVGIGDLEKLWFERHECKSMAEAKRQLNKVLADVMRREPTDKVVALSKRELAAINSGDGVVQLPIEDAESESETSNPTNDKD